MGGSLKTVCVCGNIDLRLLIGGRPAAPARETTWCYSSWQSTPEPTSTIPDKMAGYENRVSMKARDNFIRVRLLQARRKSINPQSLTLQGFSAPLSTMWSPHKPQHQLKPIQYWRRNLFFSLSQNLCLFECSRAGPPSTLVAPNHHGRQRKWVQGRRQGGARGVRDEGKVERWICLRSYI